MSAPHSIRCNEFIVDSPQAKDFSIKDGFLVGAAISYSDLKCFHNFLVTTTGPSNIEVSMPSKRTPALAKAKMGMMKKKPAMGMAKKKTAKKMQGRKKY